MKSRKTPETLTKEFEQQFVPYEEAKQLSQLPDFKEAFMPFANYVTGKDFTDKQMTKHLERSGEEDIETVEELIAAPLWQQAFDWFEDYHDISSYIRRDQWNHWRWFKILSKRNSSDISKSWSKDTDEDCFATNYETRLALLQKLIHIVKHRESCQTSK